MHSSLVRANLGRVLLAAIAVGVWLLGAATARAAPIAPAPSREEEARALLDGWLAAQNAGDFAAYQKLYAPAFVGIKRVGDRKTSYDHDQWMVDRQKMFKQPIKVDATLIRVATKGDEATITFRQAWSSGTFKDEGSKALVAKKSGAWGGSLLIAREEMLDSTIGKKAGHGNDLVVRWLIESNRERSWATLSLDGAWIASYDIPADEQCGEPDDGVTLNEGDESVFSCASGDCWSATRVRRTRRGVSIKKSHGCDVGNDSSKRVDTLDDITLPKGSTVTVHVTSRDEP
jgi:ketosteroid isomerase-like protein